MDTLLKELTALGLDKRPTTSRLTRSLLRHNLCVK